MTGAYGTRPAGPHDAILPIVLPHDALRVRTSDPQLAAVLRASGADLDADEAEVALAVGTLPRAATPHRVALLGPAAEPGVGARWRDGLVRLRGWGATTVTAAQLTWSSRAAGRAELVRWDVEHRLRAAGAGVEAPRLAERVPRRAAVVVRSRPEPWPSLLDAALEAAGVRAERVLAKEGLLVVIGARSVVRVTLRAAGARLSSESAVIGRVAELLPPPLTALLPTATGEGGTGLAAWATQRRLRGHPASAPLPDQLRRTCLELLAALHAETGAPVGRQDVLAVAARAAERLGAGGASEAAGAVTKVARQTAPALADVPTVWGHGDLWHGNLLVADDRLTGIVDWDGGGPGHLPLEDLVQLLAADRGPSGALGYGRALTDVVLPWARAGGDEDARRLMDAVGLTPAPGLLRALVAGAWLRRTASQLERYGDRARRAGWVASNVNGVVAALAS